MMKFDTGNKPSEFLPYKHCRDIVGMFRKKTLVGKSEKQLSINYLAILTVSQFAQHSVFSWLAFIKN